LARIAQRVLVVALASGWASLFGWLAVQRHLAEGTHAEDLGFTDQVLGNFLRGQWFRMSIYQGATWNTELDISRLSRPDSLLAFHFEPMLLLLVPLYALGGGAVLLLIVQAIALAAGAIPAYRLGCFTSGSASAGMAVAVAYLISPLGQWAALSDFHTSTLAAPLLLLALERLIVQGAVWQALAAAVLAASAREDVGPVLAVLGAVLLLRARWRGPGLAVLAVGVCVSILAALVIRMYSGGVSPFEVRYGPTVGAGLGPSMAALGRPAVVGYLGLLLLSGGWLGLLSPMALLPALPIMTLNVLATSPWMAAGKAHYSSLVLPFIVLGAAAGLGCVRKLRPRLVRGAAAVLALGVVVAYALEGAGPLGGDYAPAQVTDHAAAVTALAHSLPADASISASSALVPQLTSRPRVYVFPAVLDAEYIFIDLRVSPAPTSAGDTFLRLRSLLADGGWNVERATDGIVLLHRAPAAGATDISDFSSILASSPSPAVDPVVGDYFDGRVGLMSASLLPSPDAAIDIDGPRWILRTVWQADQALPVGTHLDFWLDLRDGQQLHVWDLAPLWWNPPERWIPGQPVTVDVVDVPIRQFLSWRAVYSS
jgi:uncharacterized membrane protein